jgi:hypothetical protein
MPPAWTGQAHPRPRPKTNTRGAERGLGSWSGARDKMCRPLFGSLRPLFRRERGAVVWWVWWVWVPPAAAAPLLDRLIDQAAAAAAMGSTSQKKWRGGWAFEFRRHNLQRGRWRPQPKTEFALAAVAWAWGAGAATRKQKFDPTHLSLRLEHLSKQQQHRSIWAPRFFFSFGFRKEPTTALESREPRLNGSKASSKGGEGQDRCCCVQRAKGGKRNSIRFGEIDRSFEVFVKEHAPLFDRSVGRLF